MRIGGEDFMMNDDNFMKMRSFVDRLLTGNEISQTIQLFHQWIFSLGVPELKELVAEVNFIPLFERLFQVKSNDSSLVLDIFNKLLNFVPISNRIPRLRKLFLYGLEQGTVLVKEAVLKQLEICIEDNEAIDQLSKNEDLMVSIAKLIGDTSLSVAICSANVIISFGRRGDMIHLILSPAINKILRDIMSESDTGRFRVYEIVMKLSSMSPEILELIAKKEYFVTFVTDIKSTDELTVLNCLEVSKELVVTDHGLKFLNDLGVITTMAEMALTISDPLGRCLLLPGLLKFFMNFGHGQPDYLFKYHMSIVYLYFSLLKDADHVLMCVAVDGIGLLGCSLRGKVLLNEVGKMPFALQHFGVILKTYKTEVKYNVLQALARLLRIKDHEKNQNPEFQDVLYDWFKLISEDAAEMIFKMCQQPFEEVHHGALCVISAIVAYEWGQKVVASIPGFIEFVLDRSTESTVPGKEAKFKIVKALMNSLAIETIFDIETIHELKDYYQKGPFYISAMTTVAVEEPV